MIVKHVAMRSPRKSSFSDLVCYLSNPKDTSERVGTARITNCHSDELTDAMLEVMATQACNTRAKGDKTYHLIISFRVGEQPSDDVLAAIEDRVCAALGFTGHQRVSVAHHDTDNLHIHLAINKVHPTRLTLHEPYLAYRTLAELCTSLEGEYGLEHDNHQASKHGAANRADDMERAAGIESLLGWIKRGCLLQIQSAQSWAELHLALQDNGLVLRERGNGLVIENNDGLAIKASSVSRDLSKAKLVARFGSFALSSEHSKRADPSRSYRPGPLPSRVDTSELYARYKAETQQQKTECARACTKARDQKNRAIEAAKARAHTRRAVIKLLGADRFTKKILYAQVHHALRDKVTAIQKQYRMERQAISDRYRPHCWRGWLQQQAKAGDREAIAALRANRSQQGFKGNIVAGQSRTTDMPMAQPDHVTKKGTLIYRIGQTVIRDEGDKLSVAAGASVDDLQAVLQMTIQRYGSALTISGSDEFKEHIAQAAAASQLPVRFKDSTLEKRRLVLLAAGPVRGRPVQRTHISRR